MKLSKSLTPTYLYPSLNSICPKSLIEMGKKLVLLDIDNTLLGWRTKQVPEEVIQWVQDCHSLGLKTCIVSNAFKLKRLQSISYQINSDFVQGLPKPFTHMFYKAIKKYDVQPEETIMIGDQIFTDILGGNLSKIHTILINPVTTRDSIFTKFNRILEKPFRKKSTRSTSSKSLNQFFRFIIVGGSCTFVDLLLHNILMFHISIKKSPLVEIIEIKINQILHLKPFIGNDIQDSGFAFLKVISTGIALVYGFIAHRHWTFQNQGNKKYQFSRFLTVSLIGIAINTFISSTFYEPHSNHWVHSWLTASILGSGIAAIWSFLGHKIFTFNKIFFN